MDFVKIYFKEEIFRMKHVILIQTETYRVAI